MKATELMIGDLVKVVLTTSHPAETSQHVIEKYTSEKEQIVRCGLVMHNGIAYDKYSDEFQVYMAIPVVEEDVYPITLTPEMLEANGFESMKVCNSYDFYKIPNNEAIYDRGFGIEYYANEKLFCITDHYLMQFKYVHQLQQELRLCGLNELADNFKVE